MLLQLLQKILLFANTNTSGKPVRENKFLMFWKKSCLEKKPIHDIVSHEKKEN
jgi:hypothetical protein